MARRLRTQHHRRILRALAVMVLAMLAVTGGSAAGLLGRSTAWAAAGDDLVRQWNQAALDSITDTGVPAIRRTPPVAARSLAIAHTAIYDAWAAYDNTAKPTNGARASGSAADQQLAISHAAYQSLTALFGPRAQFDALLAVQNSAPDDPAPAAQVGRQAAADILAARANDGANAPSYADPDRLEQQPGQHQQDHPHPRGGHRRTATRPADRPQQVAAADQP